METGEIVLDGILLVLVAAGAFTDLRSHRIPDWLSLPGVALGLGLRWAFFGLGGAFDAGLVASLFGGLVGFLVFGMFAIWGKGMGGGDVKLMTAVGSLAGLLHGLTCVMCVAVVGAVLALGLVVAKRRLLGTARGLLRRAFTTPRDGADRLTLPYGLPIALGVLWATLIKHGILAGF